jgi:hypothetical protein
LGVEWEKCLFLGFVGKGSKCLRLGLAKDCVSYVVVGYDVLGHAGRNPSRKGLMLPDFPSAKSRLDVLFMKRLQKLKQQKATAFSEIKEMCIHEGRAIGFWR